MSPLDVFVGDDSVDEFDEDVLADESDFEESESEADAATELSEDVFEEAPLEVRASLR